MKRDLIQVGILSMLAIVLIAAYLFVQNQETPSRIETVFTLQEDEEIVEIAIRNQFGEFDFLKTDGQWRMKSHDNSRSDQERLKMMADILAEMTVTRVLTDAAPEYGLENPFMEIAFRTSEGDRHELLVGNQTVSKAQYYASSKGKFTYLLDMGYLTPFDASATAFWDKDIFTIDENQIQGITYYQQGKLVIDLKKTENQWQIIKPYQAGAREIEIQEFLVSLKRLQAVDQVDPSASLSDLGLETPEESLVITDGFGRSQTLALGAKEGPYRYMQRVEEQDLCLIYEIDMNLSGLTPDQLLFIPPFKTTIDQVNRIEIDVENSFYEFSIGADTDEYSVNGVPIERGDLVSVFMKFITVMADGYDPFIPSGQPAGVMKMDLRNGESVQVDLYPREKGGYHMSFGGENHFYVQSERIEKLLYWAEKSLHDE